MTDKLTKTSIDDWKPQLLRFTGFLAPTATPQTGEWWKHAVGTEPESRGSKPARGEFTDSGTYQNNMLTVSVQPGRFDWFLSTPPPTPESAGAEFPILGEYASCLDAFAPALMNWFEYCPPVLRLAYGAILLSPVGDQISGYRKLANYLDSVQIDTENSRDFLYQINRPRQSRTGAQMLINRLSKWSVAAVFPLTMTLGRTAVVTGNSPQQFACRLELDISTPAESTQEFPKDHLKPLLEEFVNLGTEIANSGDIT